MTETLLWICLALLLSIAIRQELHIGAAQRWMRRIEYRLNILGDSIVEFEPASEFDPDAAKGDNARVSRANFVRRTGMRRPVRKYNSEEDAADPFRK